MKPASRRVPTKPGLVLGESHARSSCYHLLGARGYLLKSDASRHLIKAIEALAAHKPFFTDKASEVLLHSFRARPGREVTLPAVTMTMPPSCSAPGAQLAEL